MVARVGDRNAFGLRVTAVQGRMVDLECETCGERGTVAAQEFQSTRCGSDRCASSQGRAE
ncbi:hypothetical protein C5F44_08025 [Fuscovulum blasticum DSM 2131]|uniref:Uncharacterized protein n=1 Tax=Fuscovulum blasticum DSM 2131 TaxID=1188250 RepID=A0A2T4JAA0_FUSBL|nr:hypothetical protein B6K69_00500 [Fuscovulum blasticum]PTE14747.1 hypothetical protein C5F44_08025 [Fuscovulum blasticum DSM 2131]